jgi:hypothetical protein
MYKISNFRMFQDNIDDEFSEGDSKYLAREVLNSCVTKESVIFSLGLSILQVATDLYLPSSGQRWHDIRDLNIDPKFTERKSFLFYNQFL